MYNKKKVKVDGSSTERSQSIDLTPSIDASAIAVPAPASLDDKGIDMMTESPGSSSPVSVHMYVIDAVREASGGEVNRLGEFTELDAMCEKSWETRTDAKYELECKYKEQSNKPIGEDIKYRGGKQLRLICNGCDSFCVTVRMKRFRVAGEESVSKFSVIKDKSCLDHINCDPTKIKYENVPAIEEGAVGGVVQNPKRRISTSTHRTSFLGNKKEENSAAAGLLSSSSTSGTSSSAKKLSNHALLKGSGEAMDSDDSSDSDADEAELTAVGGVEEGAGATAASARPAKKTTSKSRQSYKSYDAVYGDLGGAAGGDFGTDPLSGLPNKHWTTRSEAKTELEHVFGVQANKCLGEDTKYRGGKQLKLICHGCKNFCITARMKRLRVPNSREKVSRFFVIKTKSHLEHYTLIDGVKSPCDGSLMIGGRHSVGGNGNGVGRDGVVTDSMLNMLDPPSVDSSVC